MKQIIAVAYARFSSDKQQESSITVQLAEIKRFCASHNIQLIHKYVDEAQSGTSANRISFQEMVKDAPKKEFNLIIVHRMDRWARNVDDSRYYKKYFAKYGIKIISALEEFDETPEGEFFELMSMGMAELYSKKLARECVAGKIANAKECKIHGGTPLLGYRVQGKKYVIDEKEAEAVKLIFELTLQGYGYAKIRNYLNSHGYTRSDGRLFSGHFYDVLRNRKYIGEYIYNKAYGKEFNGKRNSRKMKKPSEIIRIPNGLPRIIDDATFFKVQEILDERKRRTTTHNPSRKYLLSGLTRCGSCGKAFCGSVMISNESKYPTYKCNSREKNCNIKAVNANYLEDYLLKLFNDCLFAQENAVNLLELVKISYIRTFDKIQEEMLDIQNQIAKNQAFIKANEEKAEQEEMNSFRKYIAEQNCQILWEISELKHKQTLIEERQSLFPEFKEKRIARNVKNYVERLNSKAKDDLRETICELVNVIVIDNDKIEITINLHRLLNGIEPMHITVIEKRDYIARTENHHRQTFAFSKLVVRV